MSDRERRRPAQHPPKKVFNRSTILFVTACTRDRKPILACPEAHEALINAWKQAELWRVGRYVIMPDHIHFFCGPGSVDPIRLGTWMTYWKQCFTKSGVLAENRPIWQSGHWDRQVRGLENYSAKWQYVQENPVRHGLVAKAEDWPYQGEIESLEMIDLN